MRVVQIDLNRPEVRLGVAMSSSGLGSRESWSGILRRTRPTAAITGTYFCTSSGLPVGSIVVNSQRVYTGSVGTALVFAPGRGARLVRVQPGMAENWNGYETVLRAGPRLLTAGKVTLAPRHEGFRDPSVFQRKRRSAVALTRAGKLLLVAVEKPVLLRELAACLRSLGAVDAMCLDGGGSTALYYRGKTHVKPDRALTNLLVAYESETRYMQHAQGLAPAIQLAKLPDTNS